MAQAQAQQNDGVHIVNSDHHEYGFTWGPDAPLDGAVVRKSDDQKSLAISLQNQHHLPYSTAPVSFTKQVQFKSLRNILDDFTHRRSVLNGESEREGTKRRNSEVDEELKALHTSIQSKEKSLVGLYKEGETRRSEEKRKQIKEIEAELAALRAKVSFYEKFDDSHIRFTTLRRSSIKSTPDLESDRGSDEEVEFVEPSDLELTQDDLVPRSTSTAFTLSSLKPISASTLFVPDPCQEQQTQQFEIAIAELSEQLAHTRSALGVIKIELGNLGFSERSNESCKAVLTTIRDSFRQARIDFQDFFPQQKIDRIQNKAFLRLLLDSVRGVLARMEEQVLRIQRQEEAIVLYRAEYNGVLSKLSESDGHRIHLEEAQKQLKSSLSQKETQLLSIEKEIHLFAERLEKQQLGEVTVPAELGRLQEVLTHLEQKHIVVIKKLRKEKEEAISVWKKNVEKERIAKEVALREVTQKQKTVDELQKTLTETKKSVKTLQKQIEIEHQKYRTIETKLEQKTSYSLELESKLTIELKNILEIQKKLDIARDALTIQKQQHKEELSVEVDRYRRAEVKLSETNTELQKSKSIQKRHEERISSLTSQLQGSKDHSRTLQNSIHSMNETLTKKITLIRTLESKVSSNDESHHRKDQQIQTLRDQVKLVTETNSSLEKQINEKATELLEYQSSTSDKIHHLELHATKLQDTIDEKTGHLIQLQEEMEEERRISSKLWTHIEHIRANARKTSQSFDSARTLMQQLQSEAIKKLTEELSGKQTVVKERLSAVKSEYDTIMSEIEHLQMHERVESIKTKRTTTVQSKESHSHSHSHGDKQVSRLGSTSGSFRSLAA